MQRTRANAIPRPLAGGSGVARFTAERSEASWPMCFSATGSFAIAGVLAGLGAASMVRNSSKAQRMFAAIPFIFAAQQATEGIVWLTIHDGQHASLHRLAVGAFLGFALIVWPIWLP